MFRTGRPTCLSGDPGVSLAQKLELNHRIETRKGSHETPPDQPLRRLGHPLRVDHLWSSRPCVIVRENMEMLIAQARSDDQADRFRTKVIVRRSTTLYSSSRAPTLDSPCELVLVAFCVFPSWLSCADFFFGKIACEHKMNPQILFGSGCLLTSTIMPVTFSNQDFNFWFSRRCNICQWLIFHMFAFWQQVEP